jgi:hypothetical protein
MAGAEVGADIVCKNLKSCTEWVSSKTGKTYNLGKLEKRSLKVEKDLILTDGDPDTLFNFILSQSEMARVLRDNGSYEIISLRDIRDFTFPIIKAEGLKPSFDIFALEFNFSNKNKVKNAMIIFKKLISKNGRVVEATDGTKVFVTDTANQLLMFKNIADELNN